MAERAEQKQTHVVGEQRQKNSAGTPRSRNVQFRSAGALRCSPLLKGLLILSAIALAIGRTWYWRYNSVRVPTDDAQIDGHLHRLSSRVGGTVINVLVRDIQYGETGTQLVEIDLMD